MDEFIGLLAVVFLFGGGALFLLAISPVGKAIGDRIRGGTGDLTKDEAEQLRESQAMVLDEVESLRRELSDVQERLDFTERMLVRQRETGQLPPPAEE
jgi:hypothetical protein